MYQDLGKKIILLRKRRGLRQDDLAKELDLSRSEICNLENGRRNLSIEKLEKICIFFNVDMSFFLMSETTDSCVDLLDKAKLLFNSDKLTNIQKEDLFTSIMKIYLDSKE